MKIYISGIIQETNTFSPVSTDMGSFGRGYIFRGDEIFTGLSGTNTEINGFTEYLKNIPEVRIIPGIAAWALASGRIKDDALEELTDCLISGLKDSMPVDGVLLALHGALVSEKRDDCEGYILRRIRDDTGHSVPIVSTLDYHAVITPEMVSYSDVLVGFRTYPHVDFRQTGEKAAGCIVRLIRDKVPVRKDLSRIPVIFPVENSETGSGPILNAMTMLNELDKNEDVISASIFCPQPWLDIYDTGFSALVYSIEKIGGDKLKYKRYADDITRYVWENRKLFFSEYPSAEEFLSKADSYEKPVITVDSGDITTAGAAGDSTVFIRAAIESGISLNTLIPIVSPEAVKRAVEIGIGNSGTILFGTGGEKEYNEMVELHAQVLKICDEPVVIKGQSFSGLKINTGRRALVRVKNNLNIIIFEHASMIHDPQIIRSMGLVPETQDIIVQKSHKLFRDAYKNIARSIVIIDTPGYTDMNIKRLPFKKVKRPIYPLDELDEI